MAKCVNELFTLPFYIGHTTIHFIAARYDGKQAHRGRQVFRGESWPDGGLCGSVTGEIPAAAQSYYSVNSKDMFRCAAPLRYKKVVQSIEPEACAVLQTFQTDSHDRAIRGCQFIVFDKIPLDVSVIITSPSS